MKKKIMQKAIKLSNLTASALIFRCGIFFNKFVTFKGFFPESIFFLGLFFSTLAANNNNKEYHPRPATFSLCAVI